ncbi:MAG: adenosylmethionine--8-amino-7-oxononanoate transaminase [Gammaproteobacteria bacterium]|nr:adenosylmethionine--8-amino-7-oxononanoate transaminase [Gammaproteobacteria bacterium]
MIDLEFDRAHLWHPYTSMDNPLPVYPVKKAEGVRLYLENGRELIDGMASWWSMIHGYNHPTLNAAVTDQLDDMAHVMFGGITHGPAVELAKKLVSLTPAPLQKVFLADSGSVAIEVAIKMAMQYWFNTGVTDKTKLLTIRKGYHGDTFAAMSVCDPDSGMHDRFTGLLPQQYFAQAPESKFGEPCQDSDLASVRDLLKAHHNNIAAVILEPIVQGAGRMFFYSADYLAGVKALCNDYNVLLIADEIATGFGRSGKFFACEHAGISPDILCLGKALTGGYMTLSATLCTDKVASGISREQGVFMHGPTFMGNPLACACALASIELLEHSDWQGRIAKIETQLRNELAPCSKAASVIDVRVLGAIGVVEMQDPVDMSSAQAFFVDRGVWIRPFGKLVYIMPPYVIEADDLTRLTSAIVEFTQR